MPFFVHPVFELDTNVMHEPVGIFKTSFKIHHTSHHSPVKDQSYEMNYAIQYELVTTDLVTTDIWTTDLQLIPPLVEANKFVGILRQERALLLVHNSHCCARQTLAFR